MIIIIIIIGVIIIGVIIIGVIILGVITGTPRRCRTGLFRLVERPES
jgi:hypothetical protein